MSHMANYDDYINDIGWFTNADPKFAPQHPTWFHQRGTLDTLARPFWREPTCSSSGGRAVPSNKRRRRDLYLESIWMQHVMSGKGCYLELFYTEHTELLDAEVLLISTVTTTMVSPSPFWDASLPTNQDHQLHRQNMFKFTHQSIHRLNVNPSFTFSYHVPISSKLFPFLANAFRQRFSPPEIES